MYQWKKISIWINTSIEYYRLPSYLQPLEHRKTLTFFLLETHSTEAKNEIAENLKFQLQRSQSRFFFRQRDR